MALCSQHDALEGFRSDATNRLNDQLPVGCCERQIEYLSALAFGTKIKIAQGVAKVGKKAKCKLCLIFRIRRVAKVSFSISHKYLRF
jgi:hypothetical protein